MASSSSYSALRCLLNIKYTPKNLRLISSSSIAHPPPPSPPPPPRPLTPNQKSFLSRALRVNHAGELAAVLIYASQTPPLVRAHPRLSPLLAHMYEQEAGHLRTFESLLARHRIKPTAMQPLWHVMATGLGWATGMMGREAAMAFTEAVEKEIGNHYNRQVNWLIDMVEKDTNGEDQEMQHLLATLRRIRDEELEHLDHAIVEDSKEAKPYELLTGVIGGGCRAAIWLSERV